jgi:hypothetical protein
VSRSGIVGVSAKDARIGSETRNVDNFVAKKAPDFNTFQQATAQRPQEVQSKASRIHTFLYLQQALKSGSGPNGRRFESSRPDETAVSDSFRNGLFGLRAIYLFKPVSLNRIWCLRRILTLGHH